MWLQRRQWATCLTVYEATLLGPLAREQVLVLHGIQLPVAVAVRSVSRGHLVATWGAQTGSRVMEVTGLGTKALQAQVASCSYRRLKLEMTG